MCHLVAEYFGCIEHVGEHIYRARQSGGSIESAWSHRTEGRSSEYPRRYLSGEKLSRALLLLGISMSAASGLASSSGAWTLIAHQPHIDPGRVRIPSLLAVHRHAVPKLWFADVVALEMDFVGRVVRVVDDFEIGELISSLRRSFGCSTSSGVERRFRAIERHDVEVVETLTHRCGSFNSRRFGLRSGSNT